MKKLLFVCICLAFTYITEAKSGDRKLDIKISDGATLYSEDLVNNFYKTDISFYGVGDLTAILSDEIKDTDNDGVADKKDKCPSTPSGVAVDKTGCPLDKDLDGVADYLDECPSELGLGSLSGCPDKDKDGVADSKDRCPDVAGPADLKGCQDVDKDGVVDIDDICPNTTAGYKVDPSGCPWDNDKDGVANEEDLCPDAAGPPALKGCSDTDGDGVTDNTDRCPKEKGNIADKGCPTIAPVDVKKIADIAGKLFFENDSAKLKTSSFVQLDYLVVILNRYNATNLQIEGHTDSNAGDKYNINLSKDRAESVKTYLISKGIEEKRLTALGFGDGKPIESNETSSGRAKNRRVELKTSY
ncbi:OmpA family protein [Flavobacterium granuli]|uniref:Outer membrane protein OmpA-like peptidoglycan-associated protein n=1 Tax=Flavobacterium granuli TaxID=280093 RepID=A0ABU1S013_9FLAO|nr:OmpA family protein [Flavobacterium granuli]MDR6844381.1 outer membrane protein OmpA-like peptidoglycan-associated protein [Flavobacterium granuli]